MISDNQSPAIDKFKSESELKSYLVEDALTKYSSLFGQKTGGIWSRFDGVDLVSNQSQLEGNVAQVIATADATNSNSFTTVIGGAAEASESFVQSSSTNTQEQGVDEADLVETDGKYIYEVVGQTLTIVDARNSQQLNIASQTDLSSLGNIEGAYLQGNRLTVISNDWYWGLPLAQASSDSIPTLSGPKVNVTVFNVSDPTSVKIEEKSQLEGSLLTSRAINDQVYVVTQAGFGLPAPQLVPGTKVDLKPNPGDPLPTLSSTRISNRGLNLSKVVDANISPIPWNTYTYQYETKEQYLARIQGQELKLGLPDFTTVDGQGRLVGSGQLSQATNIYKPLDDKPYQVANVSVFDVDDGKPGPDFSTGIPKNYLDKAYMSSDNLYLLGRDWQQWSDPQTQLLKVDLNPLTLVATGDAPGRVLNQFSVDEHEGFVRVATTTGSGWNSKNNLYVLQQQGQKLDIVGRLEGLAPGETIRSARLMDDYGFMVTFREVDPFFTLDLRQPTNPQLAGELKLPGFSQYLQVIESSGKQLVLG
ncbi:beta-propeller domain-containing protein, partial [Microseira wollei]|uniref:beta-propeller domain-containing protein n=1 Tax=Microseira wollei TaxID=467598 RepID=UPI001CFD4BDB